MTADALRERIARALFLEEFPSSADAWDAPGESGRVRYRRRADAVLAVLADADPTDLGLEQIGGVAYCVMHDEMDIEGYDPMGECRRSDGCAEVPVYARPRPEETPDAG